MLGPMFQDLPEVEAGQQFDVTMELIAPNEEGEYEGCWSLTSIYSKTRLDEELTTIVPQMNLWVRISVQTKEDESLDDDSWSVVEEFGESNESESERDDKEEYEHEDQHEEPNDAQGIENLDDENAPVDDLDGEQLDSLDGTSMIMPLPSSHSFHQNQDIDPQSNATDERNNLRGEPYRQELAILAGMGFDDLEKCVTVLEEHYNTNRDLNEIVNILIGN